MITVLINTYNEEKNIAECIESAKLLSDKVIVLDMESEDKTAQIAKAHDAVVFQISPASYVEPARELAIDKAKTDWVFILDADERITKELAMEIKTKITKNSRSGGAGATLPTHYKVARKNIFGGKKWLKHGGWWPDYQIRVLNKKYFSAWPKEIHSTPTIQGQCGMLTNSLLHYFHGDFETMVEKTIAFESVEADLLYKAQKKVSTPTFFRKFFGELFRRLVRNFGFLDGPFGIIESVYQAFSKTITYLFLYEKKEKSRAL
ncbi:glycosyltransferase family 2 protein [Candidatus Roizmanbacteria bacterium]|nr:glycosyltransferase family 2 protein [Candidatus Roizmanbacteria bacterium]